MKILFVFPHPDDESFGPAAIIHQLKKAGHQVFLLTLTKGGATSQRFKYNYSIEEMGKIRHDEMKEVAKTLNLDEMEVLDFPDNKLSEIDPRDLETAIQHYIETKKPDILVTYAVHGISGFHDHLVTHAVVKRVYLEMTDRNIGYLKRLALYTLPDDGKSSFQKNGFKVKHSDKEQIDCIVPLNKEDINKLEEALACYKTYQDKIEESDVINKVGEQLYFEFYQESFSPPIDDITKYI